VHAAKLSHEDYPPAASPLLFLLFADDEAHPVAVAKVARGPEGDALVEREARALDSARRMLPPELAESIPRPLRVGAINGRASLLATGLPGEVELHHTWGARAARRRSHCIAVALDWIRRAVDATRSGMIRAGEWLAPSPGAAIASLERLGCRPDVLPHLDACFTEGWNMEWPCGLVHGDYFPGNLLFARPGARRQSWRDVSVVDWMLAEPRAPLVCDPVTYELSFSVQALRWGRQVDAAEIRAVHDLPAFEWCRRAWRERGMDLGLGGWARVATLVHAALRDGDPTSGRTAIGASWLRLLELEIAAFGGRSPERDDGR
jgi:hypothetical protein